MAQGVLFDPSNTSNIQEIAIKYNGNIRAIADYYKVSRWVIYEYLKRNPEARDIIESARDFNTESDMDDAEHIYRYAMANYKTNLGFALRAAEKVIDKKGHRRGWREDKTNESMNPEDKERFEQFMSFFGKRYSERNMADNSNNDDSKS